MAGKIVSIIPMKLIEYKSVPKFGKTKNEDKPIDGKIIVYMDNGSKILVPFYRLKVIGYYD